MNAQIIHNDHEYEATLKRLDEIFDAQPGTQEFSELELLSFLVSKYEKEKFELPKADPVGLIKFKMFQLDLAPGDLNNKIGNRHTIWKILNYRIPVSRKAAILLSNQLDIPVELLLRPYKLKKTSKGQKYKMESPRKTGMSLTSGYPVVKYSKQVKKKKLSGKG